MKRSTRSVFLCVLSHPDTRREQKYAGVRIFHSRVHNSKQKGAACIAFRFLSVFSFFGKRTENPLATARAELWTRCAGVAAVTRRFELTTPNSPDWGFLRRARQKKNQRSTIALRGRSGSVVRPPAAGHILTIRACQPGSCASLRNSCATQLPLTLSGTQIQRLLGGFNFSLPFLKDPI